MALKDKSVLVIGAGPVGGITATVLHKAGFDISIVCKYEDYRDLILNEGLKVKMPGGFYRDRIKAYASLNEVNSKKDIILLAVRAGDMPEAAEEIKPILREESLVVSMQTGICEHELGRILGNDHIAGCIIGWKGIMNSPGDFVMTAEGDFMIGYLDNNADERLNEAARLLANVMPVRIVRNITGHLYSGMIINACIASMGAITGLFAVEMISSYRIRKLFIEIIREAVELAYIMNIRIEKCGDKLDYYQFVSKRNLSGQIERHIRLILTILKFRHLKSSSLQLLERGKLTETDCLNGYISSNGKKYGVPCPLNDAVVDMIHEIEDGKRPVSPRNLDEEVFKKYYK